ncbi:MAG: LysR family transcriptional regulator [Pseudomonadales bacterium]|jgi:DNA-binding transcriptional LysR family regulator|nr:LysR family transcriptional regulator [Pseudomonadales bacterium]
MIENLETLVTLSKTGTMMETATVLKVSQSAVSKRIATLERQYARPLVERHGRRVVLTAHGTRLVERVTPLLTELRSVFLEEPSLQRGKVILGVSEAILASWAPALFARVRVALPEVEFEFHAQRSPVVLDRVRSGEYMVGLCTGSAEADTDLVSEVLRLEPMVLIPAGLAPFQAPEDDELPVITIESRSGAWASIEEDMRRLGIRRETSLESFFSAAQMALAGFGHGLVPRGVARTLGVPLDRCLDMGRRGLNRPVRFVARKSLFSRPLIQSFHRCLAAECALLDRSDAPEEASADG